MQLLSGLGLDLAKMVLIRHTPLLLVYHSISNGSKSTCVFDISPNKCGNDCGSFAINFYRAMLCIRGTSHGPVSVRLSVCPSQVGVLLKRQNVGSHKQHHTIDQGL